jgi:hypothetical protein
MPLPLVVPPEGNHTRPARSRAEPLRGRLRRALAPDQSVRDWPLARHHPAGRKIAAPS